MPAKLNKLKDFVIEYFTAIDGTLRQFEEDKNQLTMEVLNITEYMVKLGFY